jgi:hypothetical protein
MSDEALVPGRGAYATLGKVVTDLDQLSLVRGCPVMEVSAQGHGPSLTLIGCSSTSSYRSFPLSTTLAPLHIL